MIKQIMICIMVRYYFDSKIYIWEHFKLEKIKFKNYPICVCIHYITGTPCGILHNTLNDTFLLLFFLFLLNMLL